MLDLRLSSCADKALALSRHFLLHKTNRGFSFDSEIDTTGKLLNAVENGYLRFLSPSPTLRPPILKTEVKRYIDLDQGRVDFVEKFFKCAACNYLAIPAKGIASKNFANHLTQKKRTTSDDGHDLVSSLRTSGGRRKYSHVVSSNHTIENPEYFKFNDGCYVEVADGFQSYFVDLPNACTYF